MKGKKIFLAALVIVLLFSSLAANNNVVKIVKVLKGQDATYSQGRGGVSYTRSYYSGILKLTRKGSSNPPGDSAPVFVQDFLDARFTADDGSTITHVLGAVYVFFKARRSEVRAWRDGSLTIYYFDTWKSEWKECTTFLVDNNRLACRIRIYGLYGLGEK